MRPPAVALSAFSPHAAPSAAAAAVIDSMRAFGYAVIAVDPEAVRTIHNSYAAVLRFYRYSTPLFQTCVWRLQEADDRGLASLPHAAPSPLPHPPCHVRCHVLCCAVL